MNDTASEQSAPKKDMSKQREASRAHFAEQRAVRAIGELVRQGYRVTVQRDGERLRTYAPGNMTP